MNEGLTRLVAGIYAQAQAGEDLPVVVSRFRALIKKVLEGEDTVFGKLRALVDSFREVIPDEVQRYEAAIKALSTTSKLSREEIIAAVGKQFEDLKTLEKLVLKALPRGPEETGTMEARARKIRGEIARLREKIAQLEKEEKEISESMAGRELQAAGVEKALQEVFSGLGAEILSIREKIDGHPVEPAAAQPVPAPAAQAPARQQHGSGQKGIPCQMCGAFMTYSESMKRWRCASCANEAVEKHETTGNAPGPAAAVPPAPVTVSGPQEGEQASAAEGAADTKPKKACPICGGRMDYYFVEKKWLCFSCAHEETGDVPASTPPGKFPSAPASPAAIAGQLAGDQPGTPTGQAPGADPKQTCPMCGGRMDYYMAENKWQCFSCGFENHGEGPGKIDQGSIEIKGDETQDEEQGGRTEAIPVIAAGEQVFDRSTTGSRATSAVKGRAPIKKKPCPGCGRKMYYHEENRSWECNDCGYQRRT